jgi:hypothetical protein
MMQNTSRILNHRKPALRRVARPITMALQQAKKGVPKVQLKEFLAYAVLLQLHLCIVLNCMVANPIFIGMRRDTCFLLFSKCGVIFGGSRDMRLLIPTLLNIPISNEKACQSILSGFSNVGLETTRHHFSVVLVPKRILFFETEKLHLNRL